MLIQELKDKLRSCDDEEPVSFELRTWSGYKPMYLERVCSTAGGRATILIFGMGHSDPEPGPPIEDGDVDQN